MNELVNLGEVFTPEACKASKKGQVYGFKQADGSVDHYKVIRINKAKKAVWAEKIKLYTENEINEMKREDAEQIIKKGEAK